MTWHSKWSVHPCESPPAVGRAGSPAEPASAVIFSGQTKHSRIELKVQLCHQCGLPPLIKERYPSMITDPRSTLHGVFQAAGPLPDLPQSLDLAVSFTATLCFPYLGGKSSSSCLPKPLLIFIPILFFFSNSGDRQLYQ